MKRAALVITLLLGLTGCGWFDRDPITEVEFFRDTEIELTSTTRYDADAFAGFWNIRAEFAHAGAVPTRAGIDFQQDPEGEIVQIVLHGMKRRRFKEEYFLEIEEVGPGRFVNGIMPYGIEYWVLWVDEDYRTAAIGTPSGTFGWIIDRKRSGGEDRIEAAKEVLEWLGYDMARLIDLP